MKGRKLFVADCVTSRQWFGQRISKNNERDGDC